MVEAAGPWWRPLDHSGGHWIIVEATGPWWRPLDHGGGHWTIVEAAGPWLRPLGHGGGHWTMVEAAGSAPSGLSGGGGCCKQCMGGSVCGHLNEQQSQREATVILHYMYENRAFRTMATAWVCHVNITPTL